MEDSNKTKNQNKNKSSFFINILTNEKGQKFYLFILEYFKKFEISEYQKIYKTDTVREYMKLKAYVNDSTDTQKSNEISCINFY